MTASVWPFAPDWADGVAEQLAWLTDVLQSETAAEQRRALRVYPRRMLAAPMFAEGQERQLLDSLLFGAGAKDWLLPIWPDIQLLDAAMPAGSTMVPCDTAFLDFVAGGRALLRGESAFLVEAIEILDVLDDGLLLAEPTTRAWPAPSRLYPLRLAQLVEQPQLTRLQDRLQKLETRWQIMEPCAWPAVLPTTLYRGHPLLEERPDESEDLTAQFQRLLLTLDNTLALPAVTDTAGRALHMTSWRWIDLGRERRAWLRSLLYGLRGRQVAMWIPTHGDDLHLAASATAAATAIDVQYCGYTEFVQSRPGRRDIRIELWGGTALHRRITGSTVVDGIERLLLDEALGVPLAVEQVMRISYLCLCRLIGDSVDIRHETDSLGVATCSLQFLEVRDDEL